MILSLALIYLLNFFSIQNVGNQDKKADAQVEVKPKNKKGKQMVTKSEAEWKAILSPQAFRVMRQNETEAPFSGIYYKNNDKGTYYCAACNTKLFSSETKFDAGCGWPSFYDIVDKNNITLVKDTTHGMIRTEIRCKVCGSHLGHVFNDGPAPTGLRYCINSVALSFEKK